MRNFINCTLLPSIIRMLESRRISPGHVARIGEKHIGGKERKEDTTGKTT
jgi:hypothetical protein